MGPTAASLPSLASCRLEGDDVATLVLFITLNPVDTESRCARTPHIISCARVWSVFLAMFASSEGSLVGWLLIARPFRLERADVKQRRAWRGRGALVDCCERQGVFRFFVRFGLTACFPSSFPFLGVSGCSPISPGWGGGRDPLVPVDASVTAAN